MNVTQDVHDVEEKNRVSTLSLSGLCLRKGGFTEGRAVNQTGPTVASDYGTKTVLVSQLSGA